MALPDSLRDMDELDTRAELLRHFVTQDRKWMHESPARLLGNAYLQKVLEETKDQGATANGMLERHILSDASTTERSSSFAI